MNPSDLDLETTVQLISGVASEGVLQGVIHQRDGTPIDNEALQQRISEAVLFVLREIEANRLETTGPP
ncbi:hypothetical protein [Ruegeria sp. HKCCD7221]|uniref:hypothetical protein n=1 Tax=Ruegeria sp. HKCCD7221 TaxID=2683009 RepID=UPI00147C4D52|nr:hypothetical protein [Ruegeria sp. HKCCD7221]